MSKSSSQIEIQPKHLLGLTVFLLGAPLLAYLVFSSSYSVAAHEQAVVLRFGKYLRTDGPGLHFKVPWMEERFIVDQGERSLRLPHVSSDSGSRAVNLDEQEDKLILTGDLYAAVVEWNVIWRVTEPKDFLFQFDGDSGAVHRMMEAVSRSVMHRAVGDYAAEELLTGKREEITQIALKELSSRLSEFQSGIAITDLQMQRVTPPDRVRAAFDEVNASIQQRDQLVNEAYRERNRLIPAAEAQRDRLVREAEGYASRKSAEAQGEITALLAKFESYQLAPEATKDRMYLEMMERVLQKSGPKIILGTDLGNTLPVLNLTPNGTSAPLVEQSQLNNKRTTKGN
jgi:membrane protease subunit HflK